MDFYQKVIVIYCCVIFLVAPIFVKLRKKGCIRIISVYRFFSFIILGVLLLYFFIMLPDFMRSSKNSYYHPCTKTFAKVVGSIENKSFIEVEFTTDSGEFVQYKDSIYSSNIYFPKSGQKIIICYRYEDNGKISVYFDLKEKYDLRTFMYLLFSLIMIIYIIFIEFLLVQQDKKNPLKKP